MNKLRLFFMFCPHQPEVLDTNLSMLPNSLPITLDKETLIMKFKIKFFLLIKLSTDVKDYAMWVPFSDVLMTLNISSLIHFSQINDITLLFLFMVFLNLNYLPIANFSLHFFSVQDPILAHLISPHIPFFCYSFLSDALLVVSEKASCIVLYMLL